ncbi:MAG: TetR/AcrR family transcriptional regulator [Gemmatimonadota bacterium]
MVGDRTQYDDKLDAILGVAAEVFAEKGYHNASIRDIARACGVSLSGLYYYFQSKEELLYLIQDHALGNLLSSLEERLNEVSDPEQRLRALMENHLRYFVGNMAEMKVLSREAGYLGGEFGQRVSAKKRRLTDIGTGILTELQPESDVHPRVATFALFGMMNWLYTWYHPERDVGVERLIEDMTRIFLAGYGFGSSGLEYPRGDRRGGRCQDDLVAR